MSPPKPIWSVGRPVETAGFGWALWTALSALPWLLPTHSAPWATFYHELLMAAAALTAGFWTLGHKRRWVVDPLAAGFFAAALIPLLQAAGLFALPSDAPLVSLYLIGFATTLLVARHAQTIAPGRLIESLFAGLLIAALISTGLTFYQWLGGDGLGVLVVPIPLHDRPIANVGQPNNLATLMVWGLIAVWWAFARRAIGATGTLLAAAFLLAGVVLTQSRAGLLQVALMGAVALLARHPLGTTKQAAGFMALALWLVACVLALEPLTAAWTEQSVRPLLNADSPRERTMLLRTVLAAIAQHPWVGYGWYQNVAAHVAVADRFVMHGLIANAHNVVLDLVIWNGLPLGLLIVGALCLWFWRAARRAVSAEHVLLLLALGTFCVHASLELPHVFAYFLLPVAVLMGTLSAELPVTKPFFSVPRAAIGLLLVVLGAVMVELFAEYRRVETNFTDTRMRSARIAGAPAAWDPHARLLGSLQTWLETLQVEPTAGMEASRLDDLRRAVTRYPTSPALFRYAQAAAMNGRPNDARWALGVLCSVHAETECRAAANDWATLQAEGRPELAAVKVPVPVPSDR